MKTPAATAALVAACEAARDARAKFDEAKGAYATAIATYNAVYAKEFEAAVRRQRKAKPSAPPPSAPPPPNPQPPTPKGETQ